MGHFVITRILRFRRALEGRFQPFPKLWRGFLGDCRSRGAMANTGLRESRDSAGLFRKECLFFGATRQNFEVETLILEA